MIQNKVVTDFKVVVRLLTVVFVRLWYRPVRPRDCLVMLQLLATLFGFTLNKQTYISSSMFANSGLIQ